MKWLRYGNDEVTNPIHTNPRSNAQFSNDESGEGSQFKVIHRFADSYHILTVDTPGSVILRLILELWHRVGRKGVAKGPVELSYASATRSVKAGA
jgi:hypothetical protein